ncbi:hypothetical protein [Sphingomonas daechungensis]|uniref:hypothetical protein n=1 Tax=Sphingomonas daechungensis TaxID=1176646 RepID=UPI003784C95A
MKPFNRACADADLLAKIVIDDRVTIRQVTGGLDLVTNAEGGCDTDDEATLHGYHDLRRAGYPVKLAGTIMSRIREAMREHPGEPLYTVVLLANGFTFTLPSSMLDLSSGYTSGNFVVSAMTIDCRNLRERVIEVEDVA